MRDDELTELIDLATSCGVCATHMALATNNMLSTRTFQRMIVNKKLPVSPLHAIVVGDILVALRYAYATKTLPIPLSVMAGLTTQQRVHSKKCAVVASLQDALHESRKILEPGS